MLHCVRSLGGLCSLLSKPTTPPESPPPILPAAAFHLGACVAQILREAKEAKEAAFQDQWKSMKQVGRG